MKSESIIWQDKKRYMGMPISFTKYELDAERLTISIGFFKKTVDEILVYRILDTRMTQTLGQRIFGVGTVILFAADRSDKTCILKNVKKPKDVRLMISHESENKRRSLGIHGRELFGEHGEGEGACDC